MLTPSVAVQIVADHYIELNYILVYAYQGGQTCHALMPFHHFPCIVKDYGIHQGDIESIGVRVTPDLERIIAVGYEHHGDRIYYAPGDFPAEGDHPIVRCALNSHACYNGKSHDPDHDAYIVTAAGAGFVDIVDVISNARGAHWRPFETGSFLFVGLDDDGNPVSDQSWVKFQGRLGREQTNTLTVATNLDGSPLSEIETAYVKFIDAVAMALHLLTGDITRGNGPEGLGARDYVRLHRSSLP